MNWSEIFNSLPGQAIYGVLGLAFLDFILGVFAAVRDNTFKLDSVAAFVRSQLLGKVFPLTALILFGVLVNQAALTDLGYAGALAFTAATVGSIIASWGPKGVSVLGAQRDPTQPVPQG